MTTAIPTIYRDDWISFFNGIYGHISNNSHQIWWRIKIFEKILEPRLHWFDFGDHFTLKFEQHSWSRPTVIRVSQCMTIQYQQTAICELLKTRSKVVSGGQLLAFYEQNLEQLFGGINDVDDLPQVIAHLLPFFGYPDIDQRNRKIQRFCRELIPLYCCYWNNHNIPEQDAIDDETPFSDALKILEGGSSDDEA